MHKVILADNQMIFRTGVSRVLSLEPDMQIVAQCADMARLQEALQLFPGSLVLFPSSFVAEIAMAIYAIHSADCHGILVIEHGFSIEPAIAGRIDGMVLRSVSGAEQGTACFALKVWCRPRRTIVWGCAFWSD